MRGNTPVASERTMSEYPAVVLAAGEGIRLRPLTRYRPKPMLPAGTKPILEHVFDQLIDAGIDDIVVVVGYGRDRVQSHFGPTYRNVPLTYVRQKKQLGTGHALLVAQSVVDGPVLAINGDQIVDSKIIADVLQAHGGAAAGTIGLLREPAVEEYGGVLLENDGSGRVTEIVENPNDDRDYLLNVGVYVLEPTVFDAVSAAEPRAGEHLLIDGISDLVDSGVPITGVVSDGIWVDATYPWDLLDVSFELFEAEKVDGGRERGVSSTATIHDTAVLREPVVVDHDCVVGPGAVVGPNVCLGANATVGSNAVVERSVVDEDSRIDANATTIDCVTGIGVTIGPGTTIPGGPGDVRVGDRVFSGERLGALLGDRVHDHGGVNYVPGSIVGPNSDIETGTTVRGTLSEGTEVRS